MTILLRQVFFFFFFFNNLGPTIRHTGILVPLSGMEPAQIAESSMFLPGKSPALHLFLKKLINLFTGLPLVLVASWGNLHCVAWDLSLWPTGSLVGVHRLRSPTAWTCIPCIARRTFNLWTTREVSPALHLDIKNSFLRRWSKSTVVPKIELWGQLCFLNHLEQID